MASIESWINRVFQQPKNTCYCISSPSVPLPRVDARYLIIPSAGATVEIPLFVLQEYAEIIRTKTPDCISVELRCSNHTSPYTTFDRIIKDVLLDNFHTHGLVKLLGKDGSTQHTYYGTKSALFSETLEPFMMCTWLLETKQTKNTQTPVFKTCLLKPIIRVSPSFFLAKPDNVGRFILKKMIPLLLKRNVYYPNYYNSILSNIPNNSYTPRLIIEKIPFELKQVDIPSISTTNESLLNLVQSNIEDMDYLY